MRSAPKASSCALCALPCVCAHHQCVRGRWYTPPVAAAHLAAHRRWSMGTRNEPSQVLCGPVRAFVRACLRARGCVPYGCATAASYKSELALMDEIKAAAAKVVSTRLDFKCAVTLPRPPMRALLCLPSQPPCPADAGSPAARALARARSALLCGQCETRAPCRLGYEA